MIRHSRAGLSLLTLVLTLAFAGAASADESHQNCASACGVAAAPSSADCPMAVFAAADDAMPAPGMPGAPEAPGMPGARPGRRQLEQFRMLKLLELLDLKSDQETDFLVAFKAMRSAHMDVMQERDSVLDKLADGLRDSTMQGAKIYDLTNRLGQLKTKHMQVTTTFLDKAKAILTPDQFGRMVVFQERFEFELLDSIRSFREHRGRMRGGMGMGMGDDDRRPPDSDGF